MENEEDPGSSLAKDTHDCSSPNTKEHPDIVVPESDCEGNSKSDDESKDSDSQSKDVASPNTSSDLFCGTPQKTNSRRQTFITLEKYSGGKSPCPDTASAFSGPLSKETDNKERCNTSGTASSLTGSDSQVSSASPIEVIGNQSFRSDPSKSPVRPRGCGTTCEPRRLIERLPSKAKEEEDAEPDTQVETGAKEDDELASTLEEEPLSQEETLDDSQTSVTVAAGEPRRSGRQRVRPSRPGEDPKEPEEKPVHPKRTRSQEASQSGSQKLSSVQSKPNTRKRTTSEEDNGKERLRTRTRTASTETNSQGRTSKRVKLYNSSQDFLDATEPKRSSTSDSSQTELQPEMEEEDVRSQSQGKRGRKSKTSPPTKETKMEVSQDGGEASKTEPLQQAEEPKGASQTTSPSPEKRDETQELEVEELSKMGEGAKEESQNTTTEQVTLSQELVSSRTVEDKEVPVTPTDLPKTMESSDVFLSQDFSQENVLLSQDGQHLRRSRRSKVSSDTEESEEKRKNNKSGRPSRACSQVSSPANSQTKTKIDGRGRRSGQLQLQTKSSPVSTPENPQSANATGSSGPSNETNRYSSRRASQASQSKMNSSALESSEPRANLPVPKKRGRKPKVPLLNSSSLESNLSVQDVDQSSLNDSQLTQESQTPRSTLDDSQSMQEDPVPESSSQGPHSMQANPDTESNSDGLESMEGEPVLASNLDDLETKQDTTTADKEEESQTAMDCGSPSASPQMDKENGNDSSSDVAFSKDNVIPELQAAQSPETDAGQESVSWEAPPSPSKDMSPGVGVTLETEKSAEETEESPSQSDAVHEEPVQQPEDQELGAIGPTEVDPSAALVADGSSDTHGDSKPEEQVACAAQNPSPCQDAEITDIAPEVNQDVETKTVECLDEEETKTDDGEKVCDIAPLEVCTASALTSETDVKEIFLDSPLKVKDLDSVIGQDLGLSPSSRTRGTWSPSASPSTSILKKGQKRPLEDQTPSPLVKVNKGQPFFFKNFPLYLLLMVISSFFGF